MKDKDGKEVFRMAVGTKLNCIGCVRISAEDGSISHDVYSWGNKVSMPELVGIENELTDPIETKMEELKEELGEAIAITPYDLLIDDPTAVDGRGMPIRIVRIAETNLGDLCTDAIRFTTGAEVALSNGGAIRKSIPAGSISYMDVLDVYPFGNQISVIEVTGQQLLDALEWGARMVPTENGCFLQVSGLSYEIHTYVESSCTSDEYGAFTGVSGEYRVRNVKVGDEPLDLKKTYTVACINYILFEHGDGYTMFDGCKVVKKDFMLDNELMSSYLKDNLEGVVPEQYADPYGEGRIVAVEKPEKP
jgi:2',3'-cyclic-nucleotide 2'-phosphodiesterase (5'-nucleotidase family)